MLKPLLIFFALIVSPIGALRPISYFFIQHEGHSLAYDARFRNPAWVLECLTAQSIHGSVDRHRCLFREDESLPRHMRASLSAYRKSGYDRGHMSAAANHRASEAAMRDSFILSNIAPQVHAFNSGVWLQLEGHIRELARHNMEITVASGPLYVPNHEEGGKRYLKLEVIGDVVVPNYYFKVVSVKDFQGRVETSAFILPNGDVSNESRLDDFKTTVEKVESASGILFRED